MNSVTLFAGFYPIHIHGNLILQTRLQDFLFTKNPVPLLQDWFSMRVNGVKSCKEGYGIHENAPCIYVAG